MSYRALNRLILTGSARMQPAELQRLHLKLFGRAVPSGNSELARRRIAWHVQAEAEGGVPESARQHALAIAKEASLRIQLRRRVTDSPAQKRHR